MSRKWAVRLESRFLSPTTHFLLIFYYFHPLWFTIFTHSLSILPDFTYFQLSLFVFTQIQELLLIFTIFKFPAIFDCFQSLFNILTHISSPSTIATQFRLPLLKFSHFWWFTVTLTNLNCFLKLYSQIWTWFQSLLFIFDYGHIFLVSTTHFLLVDEDFIDY